MWETVDINDRYKHEGTGSEHEIGYLTLTFTIIPFQNPDRIHCHELRQTDRT